MSTSILIDEYMVGDDAVLEIEFTDENGALYNPGVVSFRYKKPDGTIVTTVVPTNPSVGKWRAKFEIVLPGIHVYEWTSDSGNSARFGEFDAIASPVDQVSTGRIARMTRSLMPSTWTALAEDDNYGRWLLNERIETVKAVLLPTATASASETSYNAALVDYVSKKAALDIIPAGIDYWMRRKISLSATGTNETLSLPDPINALRELQKQLAKDVLALEGNVNVSGFLSQPGELPAISGNDNETFVTENPFDMPPAFTSAGGTTGGTTGA